MSGAAAPFSLGEGEDACLLLHGLTGSPAEVRPVGEALPRAALLAPAVDMAGATWLFTQVVGRLPAFPGVIGKGPRDIQALAGVPPPDDRVPEGGPAPRTAVPDDGSYTAVPWRWGRELRLLSE